MSTLQQAPAHHERASSHRDQTNTFGRWGDVLGDDVVDAAMIDPAVHQAEVIALRGDSYRLRGLGTRPPAATTTDMQ